MIEWLRPDDDFPDPREATADGLLAVGGDLDPARLMGAYRRGIFPWPWDADAPLMWWSPDPRFVIRPEHLHVSRRLERCLRSGRFEVSLDTDFAGVIRACADTPRREGPGTWITDEMIEGYEALAALGHAHSIEVRRAGELVGGLYGVALGGAFFGESMFHRETDASKVALVTLVRQLGAWGFPLVDCQLETGHLSRMGGRSLPRAQFLRELERAVALPDRRGPWSLDGVVEPAALASVG